MSKIRINELARELEVKPHRILDLLPGLGVAEKKTHSSSIDDDVALKVRTILGGGELDTSLETVTATAVEDAPAPEEVEEALTAIEQKTDKASKQVTGELEPEAASAAPLHQFTPRTVAPIRPPLAGQAPAAAAVTTPGTVITPSRTLGIPAKPVPSARPGQILSGPRQGLPGEAGKPPVSVVAGNVSPGAVLPGKPRPIPSPPPPTMTQGTGGMQSPGRPAAPPQGQPGTKPLVGQPAARPVVPPRPDLVARLQQTGKPLPGQPIAKPPMPGRPPSTPTPGQPIYRGPIRPGQPILKPGSQTGSPGLRPRPGTRPMHPTTPVPPGPAPAAPDRRRDAGKRTGRRRQDDVKEKDLRLMPRKEPELVQAVNKEITISEGITVKELSEKLGIRTNLVIKKLVDRKIFANINQTLDVKLAEDLSRDFGATTTQMSYEEESTFDLEMAEDTQDQLPRPPVVTIMGHVDHGKTSLLDAIRESNVVAGEFGGITQHIGAYWVERNARKIVFIDTPGHEAFTRMRARGARVTDIVVLVVAADDGVMPQTREAIDHARAAKVPMVVAINKIDKPEAQPDRIKQQLTELGLMPEEWGGNTVMVALSAKQKQNIDLLLEMLLLVADMQGLKANPNRPAVGTVLEAKLDRGRGPVATVLVRKGTLKVSDHFICGSVFSRVRAMFDDRGEALKEAGPSMPVEVLGLDEVPDVGDTFQVVTDTAKAKQIVVYRESKAREEQMKKGARVSLEQLHLLLKEGDVKELNLILKADVGGTCEVLSDALEKLSSEKVKVRVLHTGVGAITETDVLLASASNAVVVGFNVRPDKNAVAISDQENVDIRLHTIIYELTDEIRKAMAGLLDPVFKETFKGRAEVREVFRVSKAGTVAGCYVQEGSIARDCQVRLLRDNVVVHTGKVSSLRRFKDDVNEVRSGFECGISLHNYNDVKPNDVIEAFITEKLAAEI